MIFCLFIVFFLRRHLLFRFFPILFGRLWVWFIYINVLLCFFACVFTKVKVHTTCGYLPGCLTLYWKGWSGVWVIHNNNNNFCPFVFVFTCGYILTTNWEGGACKGGVHGFFLTMVYSFACFFVFFSEGTSTLQMCWG